MRHPTLAAQELWQQWNPKNFFPLKMWVLTHILWTSEPSCLFRLLLNVWQHDTMHQSLIFAMMEPKFVILTNTAIQKGKTVLMCWMELHHQLLFEPGRTPALGPAFRASPLTPPDLRRMRRCLFSQTVSHKHTLVSSRSYTPCCWLQLLMGITAYQPKWELCEQTFNAPFSTKYFRQKKLANDPGI